MSEARCGGCLFYEKISPDYGFCRRWPPEVSQTERVYSGRSGMVGIWPVICTLDWCGEYKEHSWVKGQVDMDDPPPVPDPPEGGIISTPGEHTAMEFYRDPLGD